MRASVLGIVHIYTNGLERTTGEFYYLSGLIFVSDHVYLDADGEVGCLGRVLRSRSLDSYEGERRVGER
jgi:hypothetical protein